MNSVNFVTRMKQFIEERKKILIILWCLSSSFVWVFLLETFIVGHDFDPFYCLFDWVLDGKIITVLFEGLMAFLLVTFFLYLSGRKGRIAVTGFFALSFLLGTILFFVQKYTLSEMDYTFRIGSFLIKNGFLPMLACAGALTLFYCAIPENRKLWKLQPEQIQKFMLLTWMLLLFSVTSAYVLDMYTSHETVNVILFWRTHLFEYSYYLFEASFLLIVVILFRLLTRKWIVATGSTGVLFSLLAYASRIKFENRSELLHYKDLSLTEAAGMAVGFLKVRPDRFLILMIVFLGLSILIGFLMDRIQRQKRIPADLSENQEKSAAEADRKEDKKWYRRVLFSFGTLIGGVLLLTLLTKCAMLGGASSVFSSGSDPNTSSRYLIYRFLDDNRIGYSGEHSLKAYEELLSLSEDRERRGAVGTDTGVRPNVIVIMNESWWNTDNMVSGSSLKLSSDPMKAYHRLIEEYGAVGGETGVNIYGGGTESSEAEFLTGLNTKYFTSNGFLYLDIKGRQIPNICTYFKELGYSTEAIHPYDPNFYHRDEIYGELGFEKMIFQEDMTYQEIYNLYISDDSLAKQIILEEEKEEEPLFLFAVSIANHKRILESSFEPPESYDYPVKVLETGSQISEGDRDDLESYLSGISLAGDAFLELVEHYKNSETPTVILMYGDHCPAFTEEILNEMGLSMFSSDVMTRKKVYSTPVLMWKNYEFGSEGDGDGSFSPGDSGRPDPGAPVICGQNVTYLPGILFDYAGLPESNMTRILKNVEDVVMADTNFYTVRRDYLPVGTLSEREEQIMMDYRNIQYDLIHGKLDCREIWNVYSE